MEYLLKLTQSITKNSANNILCINDVFYTYHQFALEVSKIRSAINKQISEFDKLIGLVTNDDIQTYASIIALWLEGKAYIPVNPAVPIERNIKIFNSTETKYILDSSKDSIYQNKYSIINPILLPVAEIDLTFGLNKENDLAYIC